MAAFNASMFRLVGNLFDHCDLLRDRFHRGNGFLNGLAALSGVLCSLSGHLLPFCGCFSAFCVTEALISSMLLVTCSTAAACFNWCPERTIAGRRSHLRGSRAHRSGRPMRTSPIISLSLPVILAMAPSNAAEFHRHDLR